MWGGMCQVCVLLRMWLGAAEDADLSVWPEGSGAGHRSYYKRSVYRHPPLPAPADLPLTAEQGSQATPQDAAAVAAALPRVGDRLPDMVRGCLTI